MFDFWIALGISAFILLILVVCRVLRFKAFLFSIIMILGTSAAFYFFNISPYVILGISFVIALLFGILFHCANSKRDYKQDVTNTISEMAIIEDYKDIQEREKKTVFTDKSITQDEQLFREPEAFPSFPLQDTLAENNEDTDSTIPSDIPPELAEESEKPLPNSVQPVINEPEKVFEEEIPPTPAVDQKIVLPENSKEKPSNIQSILPVEPEIQSNIEMIKEVPKNEDLSFENQDIQAPRNHRIEDMMDPEWKEIIENSKIDKRDLSKEIDEVLRSLQYESDEDKDGRSR